jgi:hypothetical protein
VAAGLPRPLHRLHIRGVDRRATHLLDELTRPGSAARHHHVNTSAEIMDIETGGSGRFIGVSVARQEIAA